MIEEFFENCANGFKMEPGVFPPDIPKMEFFKPEYTVTHYSWVFNGVAYTRKKDKNDTRWIAQSPNRKHLLVMQSPKQHGPDNVLILNPNGSEFMRLKNPYPDSSKYQEGDYYEFDDIDTRNAWNGKVRTLIYVCRDLPGKSYKAEPHYSTFYDCETWEHTPLEFVTSKAL